jgi:hypothetical protein
MSNTHIIINKLNISKKHNKNFEREVKPAPKSLWCRNHYLKVIQSEIGRNPFVGINGIEIKDCPNDAKSCYGMHSSDEFVYLHHNDVFNQLDKAKYDWVKLFLALKQSIKNDISRANNPEHKKKYETIDQMDFIEVIQFWRELACYYRKLRKNLDTIENADIIDLDEYKKKKSESIDIQYIYKEDLPEFRLSYDLENIAWAFERVTRRCKDYERFEKLLSKFKPITHGDVCCFHDNCRDGVHQLNKLVCKEDFLRGKCSCPTITELENAEIPYQKKLIELSNQLIDVVNLEKQSLVESEGWKKPKGRNSHNDSINLINSQIKQIQKTINDLQQFRHTHYTELGMIPFEEALKNYIIEYNNRKAEQMLIEARKIAEKEAAEKEAIDKAKNAKPIIKLVKPGLKK